MDAPSMPSSDLIAKAAPRFLACLLNWGLYGALSVQVYWYYIAFPNDRWFPKTLVYSVYALDTAQTIIVTNDVFTAYAKNFGNENILDEIGVEWLAVPILTSIVSCAVQMYYGFRLKILSRSRVLMIVVCIVAFTQAIAGLIAGATAVRVGLTFSNFERITTMCIPIWLAGSVVCDVTIAICMVYLLLRNETEIAETRTLITKLVRIIIEGGTLTASAAILALILWFAIPHREYYTAVVTILGKLYSNSLLAIFNSRSKFAGNHNWKTDPLYLTYKPDARTEKVHRTIPVMLMPLRRRAEQAPEGIHVSQEVCVVSESDSVKVQAEPELTQEEETQKSPALV